MSLAIVDYPGRDLYHGDEAPEPLREMAAQGNLGVKTGKGVYDWPVKGADEIGADGCGSDATVSVALAKRLIDAGDEPAPAA